MSEIGWFGQVKSKISVNACMLKYGLVIFYEVQVAAFIIIEPPRDKTNKMACAPSED